MRPTCRPTSPSRVWHHWLVRRDAAFVRPVWPAVRRALDFVVSMQLPFGGIAWSQEWVDGRPGAVQPGRAAGRRRRASTTSLRAGVALAELVDDPQPEWELAGGRLRHALRAHPDLFLDKSDVLDGLVLPGARRRRARREAERAGRRAGTTFVVPGLGIRCVSTNPG